MASLTGQHFDGNNGFTETRDNIQSKAGNITSFNEFAPSGEERIAKVLLWAFHTMGLCCTIAGEYAVYRGGKLASRPDSIAIYIACHPQMWSSDIDVLWQEQLTPAFSMDSVEILYFPEWSIPGKLLHYVISMEEMK